MAFISRKRMALGAATLAAAIGTFGIATPAHAANDSFGADTSDGCGAVNFIDYGRYSNGSNNDDFVVLHDYCGDGKGVHAIVEVFYSGGGHKLWDVHNSKGLNGAPVYLDLPDLEHDDLIHLTVYLTRNSVQVGGAVDSWHYMADD